LLSPSCKPASRPDSQRLFERSIHKLADAEYKAEYEARPEVNAVRAEYNARPEVKVARAEY
jgi:hypothetical protein